MTLLACACCLLGAGAGTAGAVIVRVTSGTVGRVHPGFVGLSLEVRGVEAYSGYDSHAVNPVFEQIIRDLNPGQHPVLRIAGDSADWSWYPFGHAHRPSGVRFSITPSWLRVMHAMAQDLGARLIVGVNLESDSARLAGAEARAIVAGIGKPWLQALELGNEPELYNVLAWYVLNGTPYYGRGSSWDFAHYLNDYAHIRRALPTYDLAGPDVGSPPWVAGMDQFLSAEPRVRIATVHRYPLGCQPTMPATIPRLLANPSTRDFTYGLAGSVHAAHIRGEAIRIDEMNTISCGGRHGVSNTFASALWALDAQFEVARSGFDGVNIHTSQVTANHLFDFQRVRGRWQGSIAPEVYGLLAFARAAPSNSTLMRVVGATTGPVHVWATRGPDGTRRLTLINLSLRYGSSVKVQLGRTHGAAQLERLLAPNAGATGHVSLAGQSFGRQTSTGFLAGRKRVAMIRRVLGAYQVWLPAASAAILTLPRH